MTVLYFQNVATGKKFRVLSHDKETGQITMQGTHGTFTEHYDKERFKTLGYTLIREEEPLPAEDQEDA